MISRPAAVTSNDKNKNLPATFTCFINCENVSMAQYNLVHQFKEQGFSDIAFELGTMQALFVGEFLYAKLSTPSNFTMFSFYKQQPNLGNHQQDYLICHLLQVVGQKKLLGEIKTLLKQAVHMASNYNGLGTQIQLFAAASNIFFGDESKCTTNLWQLLLLVSKNQKSFHDLIALDEFFTAKFLFSINRRVQHWLCSCKQAFHSWAEVNNYLLPFYNLINEVFSMESFK
jgi:hypothetical protein